jgi:hypothetical protein
MNKTWASWRVVTLGLLVTAVPAVSASTAGGAINGTGAFV